MTMEREFVGAVRKFRLGYGEIMDLETACGDVAMATIYKGFGSFDWKISHVFHVLRIALVGGGMRSEEARALVKVRIDAGEVEELVTLAFGVLNHTLEGAPKAEAGGTDSAPEPIDRGLVYKHFAEVGIPPQQVNEMRFADALHLYAARARDGKAPTLTQDQFAEMRARVEGGEVDWSLQPTIKDASKDKES